MKQLLLIIAVLFVTTCFTSATLFFFSDSQIKNNFLPNEWTSVAECPVRYYDLGYSSDAAPTSGTPAYEREFAHMAAIGWTGDDGTIDYNCGGSLISESFILTAAHCGYWRGKAPDVVRMGDLNLERDDDDKYAQQISVEKVILHPDYKGTFKYHDLALLKLTKPIKLHPVVCPACLWINSTIKFESVEACGYGQTGFFEKKTPRLLKVKLSPVSIPDCSEHYPPDRRLKDGLIDSQLCAVDPEFKQDTCLGDSGGPIQIKLLGFARLNPFIIGVTSFGKSCGTETPGVYTRISSYIDWIQAETGENFDPLRCSHKYANFREYEPDIVIGKSADGLTEYHDSTRTHFDTAYRRYEHRAKIEPGNCGGVFIHEQFILTSASCISKVQPKKAVAGNEKVSNSFDLVQKILHPYFKEGYSNHDIALVKLTKPVVFEKDVVVPACLWTKELPAKQLEVTATGPYGAQLLWIPKIEDVLSKSSFYQIRSSEISNYDCRSFYRKDGIEITENSICYGNTSWYIVPDSCALDYGGPIGRKYFGGGRKFHNFVMGINSFGNDCGFGFPAVATKVSNYIDWIDSVILGSSKKNAPCQSPMGSGNCLPSSECPTVVDKVRNGGSIGDFICNFEDTLNPSVCCPKKRTHLDECPEIYRRFRKVATDAYKDSKSTNSHLVVFDTDAENQCYGSLISDQTVLTSTQCANSTLPLKLTIGNPDCHNTSAEADSVKQLTTTTSLLFLKEKLTFSSCLVPICLWTDQDKIPFELGDMVPYHQEKCRKIILNENVDAKFGCSARHVSECDKRDYKPMQAIFNETNLVVPYLVGVPTKINHCANYDRTFYFEKINTILDEILKFLK